MDKPHPGAGVVKHHQLSSSWLKFMFSPHFPAWEDALKAYANEKGIRIIGDIPIYVALDSADAWANPQMFQLDEDNIPTAVAGVPPDGFRPLANSGAIRSTAGKSTGKRAISGGSPACGTALNCTTWFASITSAASTSIFPFPTAVKPRPPAIGKKARHRAVPCGGAGTW